MSYELAIENWKTYVYFKWFLHVIILPLLLYSNKVYRFLAQKIKKNLEYFKYNTWLLR